VFPAESKKVKDKAGKTPGKQSTRRQALLSKYAQDGDGTQHVSNMQRLLNELGHQIAIDGKWGPATDGALKATKGQIAESGTPADLATGYNWRDDETMVLDSAARANIPTLRGLQEALGQSASSGGLLAGDPWATPQPAPGRRRQAPPLPPSIDYSGTTPDEMMAGMSMPPSGMATSREEEGMSEMPEGFEDTTTEEWESGTSGPGR